MVWKVSEGLLISLKKPGQNIKNLYILYFFHICVIKKVNKKGAYK